MLAVTAASHGARVLLVDGDEHVGPLRMLLGASPTHTLSDLRGGRADVELLLHGLSATLTLVAGGPAQTQGTALSDTLTSAERKALFRRLADVYDRYDLVVIDGGSRLDAVAGACSAGVLRLLAVSGADAIELAATYALLKAVASRLPALAFDVIVNRHDDQRALHAFEHLHAGVTQFLAREVRFAGAVPDDPTLDRALRAGMPLQDAAAGSPAALAMHELALPLLQLVTDMRSTPAGAGTRFG
jgi:MinD-like ATPase involved in chromosome partitioning or flagellar assembly